LSLSLQAKIEQMTDIIKRLKVCVKWFQQADETHVQEKENLKVSLESSEQKYNHKGYFLLAIFLHETSYSLIWW